MKSKKVKAALSKKGFVLDELDHHFYYFEHDGKRTSIRTKISHGKSEINKGLIGIMARQLRLTNKLFNELVDCTLSEENYYKYLEENNKLGIAGYLLN